MTRAMRFTLLTPFLLGACSEVPLESDGAGEPPASEEAMVAAAIPPCAKVWASGTDGAWEDSTRWRPRGVPSFLDTVCIDAPGSYTVTLSTNAAVRELLVGGTGTSAVLRLALPMGASLYVGPGFGNAKTTVRAGSEVVLDGTRSYLISAAALTNHGLIRISNSCSCQSASGLIFSQFTNHGTLHLAGAGSLGGGPLFNDGVISVTAPFPARMESGYLSQQGGSIVGTQYLDLRDSLVAPYLRWSGGTIDPNANDAAKAVVRVFGTVFLENPSGSGRLDVIGEWGSSVITGAIGTGMHLRLAALADHEFTLTNTLGLTTPFENRGTLEITEDPSLARGHVITLVRNGLINRGRLEVNGGQEVEAALDSVANLGTIVVDGTLRLSGTGNRLRNAAAVDVRPGGTLEMDVGTTFDAGAGSTMTGHLLLTNATLQGTGTAGDVTSAHGSIRPGPTGGSSVGVLRVRSLTMDATSGLTIDVGGTLPGTYDGLIVRGQVTYGGTLTVANVAPFVGGFCGQRIPIISDNSTAARGAFQKYVGLVQPGLVNRWRTFNPAGSYELVGYNPALADVFVNRSSLAVAEGGTGASYDICLGSRPPAADVVVTPVARLGRVGATPTPVTFPLATWLLPRTVTVTASDDATVDSLVVDTLTNVVTSADPSYDGAPTGVMTVAVTDDDGNADLAVSLGDVVPPTISVGQDFTARYNVRNAGPTLSTGSTFSVPGLTGFAYVSAVGAACSFGGGAVRCQVAGIASGASVNVTLTLRPLSAGTHSNTITIAGQQPDPNAANDSVVQQLTVH